MNKSNLGEFRKFVSETETEEEDNVSQGVSSYQLNLLGSSNMRKNTIDVQQEAGL